MTMFNKQVQASGNYIVESATLTSDSGCPDQALEINLSLSAVDPDLTDHPRSITVGHLCSDPSCTATT